MNRDYLKFLTIDIERTARKLRMRHGGDLTAPEMLPISDALEALIDAAETVRREAA